MRLTSGIRLATALFSISTFVSCGYLAAQSTDATVTGTVSDSSSAPVPNAGVSAVDIRTGVATNTKTNASGVYLFAALQPGPYKLVATHAGFQQYIVENLELEVGGQITLNMSLALGSTTQSILVLASAEQLETSTSTVGAVISTKRLLDLPLVGRNAYDLIGTQAGATGANGQNFNGTRSGALNITLDGVNVRENFDNSLATSRNALTVSVDRIQEFRVITSPADAEYGRGAGQIQAISRSGGNAFHGSLFEENRNTSLTANTWFNNQRGVDATTGRPLSPRNFLVRNQYGGRVGGPVKRNRTFFNVNYDGSRQVSKDSVTSVVYTDQARQGLFRYFPGVRNGNALSANPTVNLGGNTVTPTGATGPIQTVSLFGRDPNRLVPDSSGIIAKEIGYMPLPNNFMVGDGLNTAGYTFRRRIPINSYNIDMRADHQFSTNHRASFSFGHQEYTSLNAVAGQAYPGVPGGRQNGQSDVFSLSFTSVLKPNLLNEFRAGVFRPRTTFVSPWQGNDVLPQAGGQSFILGFQSGVTNPIGYNQYGQTDAASRLVPVYQYGDNITWLKGRHSFKGGFEVRYNSYAGYDTYATVTRALLGAGTVPVQNITPATLPGLATNQALAQQLLVELAGTVSQSFVTVNATGGANPLYVPSLSRYRHLKAPELDWFFKDDWKIAPNLTVNIGVRYEWYGVPTEANGLGLGVAGGSGNEFGISGTGFNALFQPGAANGGLTGVVPIGPHTSHPDQGYYRNNNHNFAPAIGLSWAVPGANRLIGHGTTVIRAGYSIGYERQPLYETLQNVLGPGYSSTPVVNYSTLTRLGALSLPLTPSSAPLQTVPLTDRSTVFYAYDDKLRTPYYQNWNFSIQRALTKNTLFELRYVGTKGTDLVRSVNINEQNIFENGVLDAFVTTQRGGNSPLLDRIFNGIGGVNGTTVSGSDYIRSNATTQAFLANNNPGALANFINTSTLAGLPGTLLRRAGLPENFVQVNPQFGTQTFYVGNFGDSNYHALQTELTKRYSSGWIVQANYTWSKAIGNDEGDDAGLRTSFRTLRNGKLDRKTLYFSREHVVHVNGLWELPFGKGKHYFADSGNLLGKLLGGWQTGFIMTLQSGAPLNLYAQNAFNSGQGSAVGLTPDGTTNIAYTPVAVGPISNGIGEVTRKGNGVTYFPGYKQVPDPSIQLIAAASIRSQSTLQAIADPSGNIILTNGLPGQFGTLSPNFLTGPNLFRLDLNLMRRFRIKEGKEVILRADAVNFTNTPEFSNPVTDINNPNFGLITSTLPGSNRVIVVGARFNF